MRWAALLGAVLVLAGCGSSSSSDDPPAATPEAPALERLPQVPGATTATRPPASGGDPDAFLTAVFDDAQAMWRREFEAAGLRYRPATITIFRATVDTACGTHTTRTGPFYCPADAGVYLDLRFFDALSRTAGVRIGDFAQAYVVAHEVAHHVQVLLGILPRVAAADERDPAGANARSVRLELQADCFAGIWKHATYRRGQLREADLADALRAAAVVGDDFQQVRATGTIRPENFTHGTARQRQHWLMTGFREGRPAACDTFAG